VGGENLTNLLHQTYPYYHIYIIINKLSIEKDKKMKKDSSGNVRIAAQIRNGIDTGTLDTKGCGHFSTIQNVAPSADGCEDCLKIGDEWVNLRLCLSCGYVGCCDSSKNKHATRHNHQTGHPVITSYEEGENWLWCYVDQIGIDPV
jgi:uncharacterized UBP type Zn finger protein